MIEPNASRLVASPGRLALTVLVLVVGLLPLPAGAWREARDAARSVDAGRAGAGGGEPGGYYEGLIGGSGRAERGAPGPLEIALIGKPIDRNRELVRHIAAEQPDDFLQFALRPDHDELLFGARFTTNHAGLRDREYPVRKPEGVFRIALLGSSIDMGWGVATPATYENRLEAWLNAESERRGLVRRFEVINFAVAAYGPAQRYEVCHRRALAYAPDLILYSSTLLDPRLTEIHLGGLIRNRVDLRYDFLRRAVAAAGINPEHERQATWEQLDRRNGFKARVKDHAWTFADETLAALAADCRSLDLPLATLLIPRACRDDSPDNRALAATRHAALAERHALPFLDLSGAFDGVTSDLVEVTPGDDHPNATGHRLLFERLSGLVDHHPTLAPLLFGATARNRATGPAAGGSAACSCPDCRRQP